MGFGLVGGVTGSVSWSVVMERKMERCIKSQWGEMGGCENVGEKTINRQISPPSLLHSPPSPQLTPTPPQGATAVLCYSTLTSPLAQPRALLLGHTLSALTSISLVKLFLLLPPATFTSLQWLLGSLSTALAIVIMQATGTTHPPAGATALLAAVDKDVRGLGWYLVPVVLLCGAVVLVTGLGVNNLQRRWPVFWWGVGDADGEEEEGEGDDDGGEKGVERREEGSRSSVTLGRVGERNGRCEV